MFNNFHLAAIIPTRARTNLFRIPLSGDLQDKLAKNWQCQYKAFVHEIQQIDFDPGYKPEDHERFCEFDYKLPEWLAEENSLTVSSLKKINNSEKQMKCIKGIVAFTQNERDEELMLFQNFRKHQVIKPGLSGVLSGDTYAPVKHLGLMPGEKLSAVYQSVERKLLFHSFYNVNIFLSLSEYFKPASEKDIRRILSHDLFIPEDLDASATDPNQWFQTRFAMLERSGFLDEYTAVDIELRSIEYKIPIQLSEDKKQIVFPSSKSAAKKLLQFLNEEIFRGPITDELFETNSKKKSNP